MSVFSFRAVCASVLFLLATGASAQTVSVQDLNDTPILPQPNNVTAYDGALYFSGVGASGREFYRYTPGGDIELLADLYAGPAPSGPRFFVEFEGALYFLAFRSGSEAWGLFRYEAETGLTFIEEPELTAFPRFSPAVVYGDAFYSVNEGVVYRYTVADGLRPIPDLRASGSAGRSLATYGGALYLIAIDPNGPGVRELVRFTEADGFETVAATAEGAFGTFPSHLTAAGDALYFTASPPGGGVELFRFTDADGGVQLSDFDPDGQPNVDELTDLDGTLYFRARDDETGGEVYRATATGVELAAEVEPGADHPFPFLLSAYDGALYVYQFGPDGLRWLRYTPGGGYTEVTTDVIPEGAVLVPGAILEGALYGQAGGGAAGPLLRYTTTGGFEAIDQSSSTQGSFATPLLSVGDDLYLSAGLDAEVGQELYRIGSEGGPVLVEDLNPGPDGSVVSDLTRLGDDLYFLWRARLWRLPGGEGPAEAVGPSRQQTMGLTAYDGSLYYQGVGDGIGFELFRYTPGGTDELAADILPSSDSSFPRGLTVYDGALFLAAEDATAGRELVRYTAAEGATVVADVLPGAAGSGPSALTVYDGALYFGAEGPEGLGLYRYTTPAGAERVADAAPSFPSGTLEPAAGVFDGALYFGAEVDGLGVELVRYTTAEGLAVVADLTPGEGSSSPTGFAVAGGTLLLAADTPSAGRELVRYTVDGGAVVEDLAPGPASSEPQRFVAVEGGASFLAFSPTLSYELFTFAEGGVSLTTRPGRASPLSPARPNPSAARATLTLTLGAPQAVRVAVYDALGREALVAFDGEASGSVEVVVETGSLAPGVYVVRAVGPDLLSSRTLTVVR